MIHLLSIEQTLGIKPHTWILVALALIIGLYLWHLSRREKRGEDAKTEEVRVLTADKLAAITDDRLVDSVIRNLLAKLDARHPDPYHDIPLLSAGRCAVYSVWVAEQEWRAGGLNGLFGGTSAKFVPLSVAGLRLIGANACADCLEQAAELPPEQRKTADTAFEKALAEEAPAALCVRYIRDSVDEFVDE